MANTFGEKYLYLKVHCKTPDCNTVCILKFLGPYFGQGKVSDLVPEGFEYECERHHRHRYVRSEVAPIVLNDPPPPGFKDSF